MGQLKYLLLLTTTVLMAPLQGCKQQVPPETAVIAHACGGVYGKAYTNSIEALNHNYERGFRLFEIDFSWTNDNHLVCLYDWTKVAARFFNYSGKKPLSLSDFKTFKHDEPKITPCHIDSLNQWLLSHPDAYIITDIKGKNIQGLRNMVELIHDARHRVIPQFTQPEHYPLIKEMGYQSIIWTLHSYKGTDESLIEAAKEMNLWAVTMPQKLAKRNLAHKIKTLNIPTYVHTINEPEKAIEFQRVWGVSSVYTDFLTTDYNDSSQ